MTTFNPNKSGHIALHADKTPGLFFRKRVERIDWKRLASVDVRRVVSQMDIDALQDNLVSVAFCDIDSEIDTRNVDTNLIKLFQLAQLLIEYLLYSQDCLKNTVDSLRRENENIIKEADLLKRRLDEQTLRLTTTRKECHRRRLLLLAQQRLMNNGPQSYFRCPHCPKAFINASFLSAHLYRRHAEVITALQNIDLNRSGVLLPSFESSNCDNKEKAKVEQHHVGQVEQQQATLINNLEEQIKEVLDHIKTQPPPPPPLPSLPAAPTTSSATVQTAGSKEDKWKKRATELERQLEEERDQLRQLEERNRAWQDAITSQHKVDVERVRETFEAVIRNLREENLEAQKELVQLRLKGANEASYTNLEDDVPVQLERQVKSLERKKIMQHEQKASISTSPLTPRTSSEKPDTPLSTLTYSSPSIKMVNNANKAVDGMSTTSFSWHQISRGTSCCDEIRSVTPKKPVTPSVQSRCLQTSYRGKNVSLQANLCKKMAKRPNINIKKQRSESERSMFLENQWVTVEGLIMRPEEEEKAFHSIHLIPFVFPASQIKTHSLSEVQTSPKKESYRPYHENRVIQFVDDSSYTSEYTKERLRQSRSPPETKKTGSEKVKKSPQASDPELRAADPLEGVSHYKDQMKNVRANPDEMRRLRKEAESLLEEQLIDHDVEVDAKGLSRGKFNETTDILGLERQHLVRKYPNFEEIRAALSRKVDRMALQALHSKREYTSSSPSYGENGSLKRARTSRIPEVGASGRPASGRPSSLTSLATTLSPIAEHRRGATASPTALRRPAATHAQSKQSLFEDSENEDEDEDVNGAKKYVHNVKGEKRRGDDHGAAKMASKTQDEEDNESNEDYDDDDLEEEVHVEDYRFVGRKFDDDDDDEDDDSSEDDHDAKNEKSRICDREARTESAAQSAGTLFTLGERSFHA
ncbi:hypothetical protein Aperf_G00000015164 [Anoplocephala perfoliata]